VNGSTLKLKSAKAFAKEPKKVDRSAQALRRLQISPEQLAAAPQITPLLKQAEGGIPQVIAAMRFAPDEVITTYLEKYDTMPVGDRDALPIEAIALAAEVDIRHLLGSIMVALQQQSVNAVKIIALTSHPRITQARVIYGQHAFGERDRTALDTAMGFLPSPKGPTFIGKAVFGSGKSQTSGDDDEGEDDGDGPDLDKLFPPANNMQEKLTPIRQRTLPPGQ
jgi:hypothetical protein